MKACIIIFLLPALLVFGQEFEVASIKPSIPGAQGQAIAGLHIDGAMVRYSALSLKLYLGMAYDLENYRISVPDWMASDRWDITAKLPDGSDPKQIPRMLQVLLRDRFQMKMHRETKEFPVYGLILGKGGLRLKESSSDRAVEGDAAPKQNVSVAATASGTGTVITYGNGSYLTLGDNKFEGKKLPMSTVAAALARFADRPVVDMTDLKGAYDFTMEFSPEDFRAMMIRAAIAQGSVVSPEVMKLVDASSGDTLFNAVEKLGLKLESRKAPMEMLVIDQAMKTPTEN
jgi:uncharacterized protein (TIGR03435 family)